DRRTDKFKPYLTGIRVLYLYEDSRNILFAGTDNGLYYYDEKKDMFQNFLDPKSRIYFLEVGGITEDNDKNLWLTSPSAIIKINPGTKETQVYGSKFGINPNSLDTKNQTYKDQNGHLYVPYESGFFTFLPKELEVGKKTEIIVTDFL